MPTDEKTFRSPDGIEWSVEVEMPTHSNALVIFRHPTAETGRLNRYAWVNARVPQAADPRGRLQPGDVLRGLTERDLGRLFRRSMPIETVRPSYIVS